jgi:hypothetical protein
MMTPTASSTTLPLTANALNSFITLPVLSLCFELLLDVFFG